MQKVNKYPKIEQFYIGDIILKDKYQGRLLLEIRTDQNFLFKEIQSEEVKIKFESDYNTRDLSEIGFDYSNYMKIRKFWVKKIKLKDLSKEINHLKKSGLNVVSDLNNIIARMI